MARTIYRVLPDEGDWLVKRDGAERAAKRFDNKAPAVSYGSELAKNNQPSQLVIHKMDGQIEKEYTYGDDPYPPSG